MILLRERILMHKIGIINFHRAINYGAVLQAYALSEAIKKLGYNAVTIDYKNPLIEKIYNPRYINYKSLKGILSGILTYNRRKRKKELFEDFRAKYFTLYEPPNLYSLNTDEYYKFITGSDQVWNYNLTEYDTVYFLEFISVSKKKNSYAASFGFDEIPDEYVEDYRGFLEDFNQISVREEQGAQIIKNLLNRHAEVVLDPTMLLSKEEWIKISKKYKRNKNYILIYQLAASQSLLDFAVELSKQTNCEIINISDAIRRRIKAKYVTGVGPQEFMGLFSNARYIVTNSFHGTAFSINFNKPFFVEMLPPPAKVNSRLENILDTFDLRSRQIINGTNANIFTDIDYATVSKKLELERKRSLDYLKRILDE
jgi:hypothetical protein